VVVEVLLSIKHTKKCRTIRFEITSEPNLADIQNEILDFDANAIIVESGTYKLKPVVRTIVTAISGNIKEVLHL
jgi:hypothetical protein